jgi:hypothetical protein
MLGGSGIATRCSVPRVLLLVALELVYALAVLCESLWDLEAP